MPYLLPSGIADRTRQALPWLQRGSWTILDQAFFSGANFVVNILLIRWLSPEGYGTFAVAFALFLFFSTIHTGFITEPMLVFAERFNGRMKEYFRVLARGHVFLSTVLGLILALGGFFFSVAGHAFLGRELIILAVALPFMLWMWLLRRACYMNMQPGVAAAGSMFYAVLVISGLFIISYLDILSVGMAFAAISVASTISGIAIAVKLGFFSPRTLDREVQSQALNDHWDYGKWAVPTGGIQWASGQFAILVLPIWVGIAGSGEFRALDNLLLPAAQVYTALSLLLLPVMANAVATGELRRVATVSISTIVALMTLYWIGLLLFGPYLIEILYGKEYTGLIQYLWIAGLLPIAGGITVGLCTVLRALNFPEDVFKANVAGFIFALSFGFILIWKGAILGAIIYHLGALLIEITVLSILIVRRARARSSLILNEVQKP